MIRILLVDDQKVIREAVKKWLEPEADFQIIGTADNGITALEQVEKLQPDIVLMNMEMPGLDGASATKFITDKFTNTKVLILSSFDSSEYIAKSLSVGAKGYLLKNTNSQDVATAIRSVHKGYTQIAPGLLEKLLVYTDSGTVINNLQNRTESNSSGNLLEERQLIARTKRAILRLHSRVNQQKKELKQLHHNLQQTKKHCSKTKKDLSRYSKLSWLTLLLLLASIPLFSFFFFQLNSRTKNLEANALPIERIGIYREYDLSGLAQRVAKTFEQDTLLTDVATIYVAQEDSTIILKGTISDLVLLDRMKELAQKVNGVEEVDTNQVEVIGAMEGNDNSVTKSSKLNK